jgi:hypothetical protein
MPVGRIVDVIAVKHENVHQPDAYGGFVFNNENPDFAFHDGSKPISSRPSKSVKVR